MASTLSHVENRHYLGLPSVHQHCIGHHFQFIQILKTKRMLLGSKFSFRLFSRIRFKAVQINLIPWLRMPLNP